MNALLELCFRCSIAPVFCVSHLTHHETLTFSAQRPKHDTSHTHLAATLLRCTTVELRGNDAMVTAHARDHAVQVCSHASLGSTAKDKAAGNLIDFEIQLCGRQLHVHDRRQKQYNHTSYSSALH